ADENGLCLAGHGVGANYLAACAPAPGVAQGIREVLVGASATYRSEYACHSPHDQRWFQMRVTRFPGPGPVRVVVTHEDITHRVLSEQAIRHRSEQLQELARVAVRLNVAQDLDAVMGVITDAARRVIGAHLAITSQAADEDWSESLNVLSLSPKYDE